MVWKNNYDNGDLTIDVELTTNCNAKCPQCSRTDQLNNSEKKAWLPLIQVSLTKFKSWFSPLDLIHIKNIHFSGTYGDPGMCKELLEIVTYIIKNSNSTNISINTNGGIRDELYWWKIGAIGGKRLSIIFDIDGIDEKMHSFYRQNVSLKKVLDNMEAVLETNARVKVLTVLFEHNENYLNQIQDMCRDLGVKEFDSVEGNNFQRGPEYPFRDPDGNYKVLKQVTRADREQGLERLDRRVRDHRHKPKTLEEKKITCLAIEQKNLKVHATGIVAPCCFLSTPLEMDSIYRKNKPVSYHITTSGKEGDEMSPIMKEYVDRYKDFMLPNRTLKEIVNDKWFTKALMHSWLERKTSAYGCVKVCGNEL